MEGLQATSGFGSIPMRTTSTVREGAFEYVATEPISVWHRHDLHEIEYVVSGTAELLTADAHFVRSAGHAAWIPAGVAHCPVLQDVHTIALFFDPADFEAPASEPACFPVPPVLREMLDYARRWPITRDGPSGRDASTFFQAMVAVVRDELEHGTSSPSGPSGDPLVADILAYTTAHLRDVTSASLCRAVGISERTLRRRFPAAVGETWQAHVRRLRLGQAVALLHDQHRSIADIAVIAGFDSASSFTRAFRAWMGDTPSGYREQVLAGLAQKSSA